MRKMLYCSAVVALCLAVGVGYGVTPAYAADADENAGVVEGVEAGDSGEGSEGAEAGDNKDDVSTGTSGVPADPDYGGVEDPVDPGFSVPEPAAPEHVQEFLYQDGAWHYYNAEGEDTGVVAVKKGWVLHDGIWFWFKSTTSLAQNQWLKTGGAWYYLGENGHMLTGHQLIDGKRYYLFSSGAMLEGTGWKKADGRWYYVDATGALNANRWRKLSGTWYLFDEVGRMRTGWAQVDGTWYFLNSSGAMETGWLKRGSTWYYLKSSGAMAEGWAKVKGTWYYLTPESGAMATGWLELDEGWYFLNPSGAMATGWLKRGSTWYYLNGSGLMQTGWQKVGGSWYLLKDSGAMRANEWYYDDDYKRWYYLTSSGRMDTQADSALHDMIEKLIDEKIGHGSDALRKAFDYVAAFPYRDGSKYPTGDWSAAFAKEMVNTGSGNCYRYAALFCWLARGLGYEANVVTGWVPGVSVAQAPHGWVEVRKGGTTYVCDPDLAHEIPSRDWFMVTYAGAPLAYGRY